MNAVPQFINNRLTLSEGQTIPVTLGNLDANDADNAANTLQFTISNLVGGRFELVNGQTVVAVLADADATPPLTPVPFTRADVANNRVRFVHNGSETPPSYSVTVSDGVGGTTSSAAAVTFNAENDPPLFEVNQITITEGGSVILNNTAVNGVVEINLRATDEETPSADLKYAVLNVREGQFELLNSSGGSQVVTEFTQGQVDAGLIRFSHRADSEIPPTYTLSVTDSGGATAISDLTLLNPNTFAVNDPPTLTANTLKVNEGQSIPISTLNFNATDPDNFRGGLKFTVTPATDPTTGSSLLAGRFLVRNAQSQPVEQSSFTLNDVLGGRVSFQHDGSNRTPQYSVTVSDGSLTTAPAPAQVQFTPVNDQPAFANNTLTISEGGTVILSQENLSTTDEESGPEALTYTINQVARGQFALVDLAAGTTKALALGGTFTQAQVNAGAVQFTHDGSELAPTYTLTVQDSGINGSGVLTVTRDVTIPPGGFIPVNDAPKLVANTLTLLEGETVTLTSQNLKATDVDNPAESLIFTITGVTGGRFERVGATGQVEVLANGANPATPPVDFTQNEILLGRIRFVHDPATDTPPTYQVQVRDAANPPGVDSSAAAIKFTPINDVPTLKALALTVTEGQTVFLNAEALTVVDEETGPEGIVYTVDKVVGGSFVDAQGKAVTSFTQAQINAGNAIAFTQDNSNTAPSFTLTAVDGLPTAGGNAITIDSGGGVVFIPANDPPIVKVSQFNVTEGSAVKLTSAQLNTVDEESTSAQLTYTVDVASADPAQPDGFRINGKFVTGAGITFTQAQVGAGLVEFVQGGSNSAPQLKATVSDEGGANTVPVDLKAVFTAVNDAPLFTQNVLTITEGATVVLNSDPANLNLVTTDEESGPQALIYTIDSVTRGEFSLVDGATKTALAVGATFTQAQVNAGLVQFTHDGSELAPTYILTVKDSGLNGDPATGLTATREVTIPLGGFQQVNDLPTIVANTLTLTEGDTVTLSSNNLKATDPETNSADLVFTITSVTGGRFERVTGVGDKQTVQVLASAANPPTAPVSFTQNDILAGTIRFVNDPATDAVPTYSVKVQDLSDPAGVATSDAKVNFTAINDVPVLKTLALTVGEGAITPVTADNLSVLDEETGPEGIVYTVNKAVGGNFFDAQGNVLATFTQAQINAGNAIAFVHDNSNTPPSFTLTAADGPAASGGKAITFDSDGAITFVPVNDLPIVQASELKVTEGETVKFSSAILNTVDEETGPEALTYTVTLTSPDPNVPATFIVAGKEQAGPVITFTQAQVNAGLVQFVQGGGNAAPGITVTVSDKGLGEGAPNVVPVDFKVLFTPVNDTPQFIANTLKITEGGSVVLNSDPAGLNLRSLDEESGPEALTYTIDKVSGGAFAVIDPATGAVVTELGAGGKFTQAQVDSQSIRFTHDNGEAPPAYTLTVTDQGIPGDTTPRSVTKTLEIPPGGFIPVNDPPVLDPTKNQPLVLTEGGTVTLSDVNLFATDAEGQPLTYTVTLLNPAADPAQQDKFVGEGVAQVDAATYSFTQAAVSAGTVQFVHGGSNAAPQFKVLLSDTFDPPEQENTLEIPLKVDFKAINDAPVFLTNTLKITEGDSVVLNKGSLNLVSTDEETGPETLTYKIDTVANGQFERINPADGKVVGVIAAAGTFTQQEVNSGAIRFVHNGSEIAPTYTLTVTDTGTPGDETPKSVTKTVEIPVGGFIKVNDAPSFVANTLAISEGGTATLTLANLKVSDPDSVVSRIKLQITDVVGGQFFLNGQPLTPETTFTQSAVAFGQLTFVDDGLEGAPSYTVIATDLEGASTPLPAVIAYTPVNDPPRITVNSFVVTEGQLLTLNEDPANPNLQAADDETTDDTKLVYTVSNVKGGRFATFEDVPVESFTQQDLNNGDIVFLQDGSETVPSFDITVTDPDGGSFTEAAKVKLVPVNDAPVLTTNQFQIQEGGTVILTTDNLSAADPDNGPADLVFSVAGLVAGQGRFDVDSDGDGVFDLENANKFTLAQVAGGQVRFVDDGDETPPAFTISVSDGQLATAPQAAKVQFTGVNDPPDAVDDAGTGFTTKENTKLVTASVLANDIDPDVGDVLTVTQVNKTAIAVGGPAIKLASGALLTLNEGGTFSYDPNKAFTSLTSGKTATDTFSYTVSDKSGATDTATVSIVVTGVNDPPTLVTNTLSITEGATVAITKADLLATDPDNDPTQLTFTVGDLVGGTFSRDLDGDGKADETTTKFTQQEVLNGRIFFVDDGDETPPSYSISVSDGLLATAPAPVTIGKFTNVNDVPIANNDSGTGFSTNEDTPFITGNVLANDSDPDIGDVLTITAVNGTNIAVGGAAVIIASGARVSLNNDGTFTYDPNKAFESLSDGKIKTDTFSYTISDGKGGTATATVSVDVTGLAGNDNNVFDFSRFSRYALLDNNRPVNATPFVQNGLSFANLFDESYYLRQNSDVAAAVNTGAFSSGYDHFIRFGWREGRNPSLLYNEAYYLSQNPDVAQAVAGGVFSSGFVHFVQNGQREGRNPSALFNQQDYLLQNPDVASAVNNGVLVSAFEHYAEYGLVENRQPTLSLYNEDYYLSQNPDVARAVAAGVFTDGFDHYIRFGQKDLNRNPSPLFSESNYLALNPDVQIAVANGVFSSGFEHYEQFGRFETRNVF